jgi:hypothetical protein
MDMLCLDINIIPLKMLNEDLTLKATGKTTDKVERPTEGRCTKESR